MSHVLVRVRYAETDQMAVAYHANYLIWCEIGRVEHLRSVGVSYRDVERTGIALAVAEATVRYHAPARYDDLVRVESTVDAVGSRNVTFSYLLTNAESGERLATARTTLVSLDRDGRVARMPDELRRALALSQAGA